MHCKNCGHPIDGNFCSHCGQSTKVGKINLSNFLKETTESVFQVNKGFFYTLKALFIRPGKSLKEFLDGKRKYHFKPIGYVILLSTIYYLLSRIAKQSTLIDDLLIGFFSYKTDEGAEIPALATWLSKNYAYATLMLLPIFSLASSLFFWRQKRNYLEHIVLNAYITGQQAIFYAFFITIEIFIDHEYLEVIPVALAITYNFWVFWQFFSKGNRIINLFCSLLTYILFTLLSAGVLLFLVS